MDKYERIRSEKYLLTLLPEEKAMLDKGAYEAGLTKACYLRNLIFASELVGRQWTMEPEAGQRLLYETNRIGNNINQIAYHVNQTKAPGTGDQALLLESYKELLKLMGELPFLRRGEVGKWQQRLSVLSSKQ